MFEEQETTSSEMPGIRLGARVDELATRLMIEGDGSTAAEALRSLSGAAQQCGFQSSAGLADALLSKLKANPDTGVAYLLSSGLAELRASFATPVPESVSGEQTSSLGEDTELVADFLVEAREHLSQIEGQMLTLERDPSCMEIVHAVFRAFHTIKGLAGFLAFQSVQAVSHEVETLLDLARNQKLMVDSAIADIVLESGDFLQGELAAIERALNGKVPLEVGDSCSLVEKVRGLATSRSMPHASVMETGPGHILRAKEEGSRKSEQDGDHFSGETQLQVPVPAASSSELFSSLEAQSGFAMSMVEPPPPRLPENKHPAKSRPTPKEPGRPADASSVRVDTAKLDYLMDMVGEIVIAQSLIRHNQAFSATADTRLLGDLSQLARVTAEVQRATMSMRMIPVGQLFQRIERVIRDLSRKANKQVILETDGTETEIDKTVAEELADPLLHMVRNSVDHGIELPADRIAAGKPAAARICLSAHHQGGQIVIEISDDGRGLSSEKIRRKAEERQLIAPNTQLTEAEIYQLIFEPGFSTADQITDVSGRGVGMDVVRRNVEKLRGRIETHSTPGRGTTFLLNLPLTLAIIDGLVIEIGDQQYIIPLSRVREIFRPRAETLFTVEGKEEMVLVRDQLMPVVRLHQRLGVAARTAELSEGLLVIVEAESRRVCLLVDDLLGKQEVVIKSLGTIFQDVPGISGCAVLGDGRVGLILDVDGVYRGRRR